MDGTVLALAAAKTRKKAALQVTMLRVEEAWEEAALSSLVSRPPTPPVFDRLHAMCKAKTGGVQGRGVRLSLSSIKVLPTWISV